jgi:hypothetical protein
VNTLTVYRFKSDHWASSVSLSSSAACWNRSDAAPPTVMTVPTPMFVVQIKSVSLRPAGVAAAHRRAAPAAAKPPPTAEARQEDAVAAAEPVAPAPRDAAEAIMDLSTLQAETGASASAERNAEIELIIDSLPHLSLIQSIPVTVQPFGDKIFTATVRSLGVTGTGASIGETLLLLKDQIESIYHELSDKSRLDEDQRKMQDVLDTFIAKSHKYAAKEAKKSEWFRR